MCSISSLRPPLATPPRRLQRPHVIGSPAAATASRGFRPVPISCSSILQSHEPLLRWQRASGVPCRPCEPCPCPGHLAQPPARTGYCAAGSPSSAPTGPPVARRISLPLLLLWALLLRHTALSGASGWANSPPTINMGLIPTIFPITHWCPLALTGPTPQCTSDRLHTRAHTGLIPAVHWDSGLHHPNVHGHRRLRTQP